MVSRVLRSSVPPWRILFFGTDSTMSLPTLKKLHHEMISQQGSTSTLIQRLEVVCPRDQWGIHKRSRILKEAATKIFCRENDIEYHEIPPRNKEDGNADQQASWAAITSDTAPSFDLGVVVSFGHFLPPTLLGALKHGAINLHPSLLPKYRGAAPVEHALLNNDAVTGISVIEVDPARFDAGSVLLQRDHTINQSDPDFGAAELKAELAAIGADAVLYTLQHVHALRATASTQRQMSPQASVKYSRAPKIRAEDGLICWATMAAEDIFGRWRALSARSGLYSVCGGRRVQLRRLRLACHVPAETRLSTEELCALAKSPMPLPGAAVHDKRNGMVWTRCRSDGEWIGCAELQIEGRKWLTATQFANGFRMSKEPLIFGSANSS